LALIKTFNPNVKYADLSKKGYLLLDVNNSRIQGDWNYMSTIQNRNFTSQTGASWRTLHQANKLSTAPSALTPRGNLPSLAPEFLVQPTFIQKRSSLPLAIGVHYNPQFGTLSVQAYRKPGQTLWIRASTMEGKILLNQKLDAAQQGLWEGDFRLPPPSGRMLVVSISDELKTETRKIGW
jgi:hypothetical protein